MRARWVPGLEQPGALIASARTRAAYGTGKTPPFFTIARVAWPFAAMRMVYRLIGVAERVDGAGEMGEVRPLAADLASSLGFSLGAAPIAGRTASAFAMFTGRVRSAWRANGGSSR